MNCAYHPERPSAAFCQNCGKSLCSACTRAADGLVLCEPCLLLRHPEAQAGGFASTQASSYAAPPGYPPPAGPAYTPNPQAGYTAVPYTPGSAQPYPRGGPSPALAGLLGTIPGVGAMYNGQFIKAFVHVVVFAVLVGLTERFDAAGILIAAWFFYQIFDAAHTAAARRDGRPLPDPFGILDLSRRVGPPAPYGPPSYVTPPPVPPGAAASVSFHPPSAPPRRGEPVGAIVLIAVGLLFLMSTLGLFDVDWVGRGWPFVLILVGVWLLIRRARSPYPPPLVQRTQPAANATSRSPFSISPEPPPSAAAEPSAAAGKEEPR